MYSMHKHQEFLVKVVEETAVEDEETSAEETATPSRAAAGTGRAQRHARIVGALQLLPTADVQQEFVGACRVLGHTERVARAHERR